MSPKSQDKYQYKRLLEKLSDIKGRGTELITVYVPPGYELSQVVQQLREEQGTAENIKSKNTRKNVTAALGRIINFLQKYIQKSNKPPENGMAIFSGNVTGEEGSTDIKLYWVEPPEPIQTKIYRCDQDFLLGPLKEAIEPKEEVGLIVLDTKEATVATLRGKNVDIAKNMTSGVWGKHSKGGQSSQRFERLREVAVNEFLKRVAEVANREFSDSSDLKAVLVGGPGPIKNNFLKSELLNKGIQEKVSGVIDTGYTDEQGVKELVNKASDILEDLEVMREKSIVQDFLSRIASGQGLATYGKQEIKEHLQQGAVDTLLISEELKLDAIKIECQACNYQSEEIIQGNSESKSEVTNQSCPNCGKRELEITETEDAIEEFCELADQTGADVEFVSTETEEGQQLLTAFKGLGALLRFRVT
ncbi:MAG: peptide chain release factor aRF-1 [Hadesarchaea archaeon]|nr:peptide chain release factor aRF-1 [Hadesarchaea archaeon]